MIPLTAPPRPASPALPSLPRTGLSRGRLEVRSFFADRESVIFTFALPVILLFVFGQIFRGDIGHTGVPFRQYFAAGIIASGVMSATFVNMGTGITTDRDSGMLKRLAGSPLAPAAYFTGRAISALAVAAAETSILFAAGVAFLGLRPPATPGHAAGTCTTGSSC